MSLLRRWGFTGRLRKHGFGRERRGDGAPHACVGSADALLFQQEETFPFVAFRLCFMQHFREQSCILP